jgi:DtxR family transcriptional regulator, Mn-dependent transcriptional regulator
MNACDGKDELLERLWTMNERGERTEEALRGSLEGGFAESDLADLAAAGFAVREGGEVLLTAAGKARAERLIRAHRLGERLIHDVLGKEYEPGACEFEHIVDSGIVDAICTLLGHPRECPHGFPIPEGECCRTSARFARRIIVPLGELAIGQSARIASVHAGSDQQLHRLSSLRLRPGVTVKMHQTYPAFVVECEGASVALDEEVVSRISVWMDGEGGAGPETGNGAKEPRHRFARPRWRWRSGRKNPS